ncbi:hypothetical protein Tco_0243503 [Tanacetum coccineum]
MLPIGCDEDVVKDNNFDPFEGLDDHNSPRLVVMILGITDKNVEWIGCSEAEVENIEVGTDEVLDLEDFDGATLNDGN